MELLFKVLIYTHATFGGISLLAGTIAALANKFGKYHQPAGLVFFYSLLISCIIALVITFIPGHRSIFLFCIAVFSLYQIITGRRAVQYKRNQRFHKFDQELAYALFLIAIGMIAVGFVEKGGLRILLWVFGVFCAYLSVEDTLTFRNPQKRVENWLKIHISRMGGGFIASITAFMVVNRIFPGIWGWFIPGIVGGFLITLVMRKYLGKKNIENNKT
jgi:Flp pilus assembly protein TadB